LLFRNPDQGKILWQAGRRGLLSRTIQWKPWWQKSNSSILFYGKRGKPKLRDIFYEEFDGGSRQMS
jgi:hypothetical protein